MVRVPGVGCRRLFLRFWSSFGYGRRLQPVCVSGKMACTHGGDSAIRLAIAGCSGRMGERLVALSLKDPQFLLLGGLRSTSGNSAEGTQTMACLDPRVAQQTSCTPGRGTSGTPSTTGREARVYASLDELVEKSGTKPDVVVDFSKPDGTLPAHFICPFFLGFDRAQCARGNPD